MRERRKEGKGRAREKELEKEREGKRDELGREEGLGKHLTCPFPRPYNTE